jgi:aldehyde dehydrogenase (NAD+)
MRCRRRHHAVERTDEHECGKVVPALAAGNTVVLKPAPDTPLADVVLAEAVAKHTDIPAGTLPWGDPHDESTVVGPIIRKSQLERMAGLVDRARMAGASIPVGGRISDRFGKGFWYEPTVVAGVDETAEIAQTEVFGPVLTVLRYEGDDNEAIRVANATSYGLGAFVQSTNPDRAWNVASRVRSGGVAIGPSFWVAPDTPFGGYGASGLGRERGVAGFVEFLQTKAVSSQRIRRNRYGTSTRQGRLSR